MKFSCTQENLNHGLQIVGSIANKNVNLPILQNVLIRAKEGNITLSSTNLEIGIEAQVRGKIEQDGEFTLPAQLLANYMGLVDANQVNCVLEGKEFRVHAGEQDSIIKGESAEEFPILPAIEKNQRVELDKNTFQEALHQVVVAASLDETRPEIAGVFLNVDEQTLTLAATDSYRLAEKKISVTFAQNPCKVILPQRSAQELLRIIQMIDTEQVVLYISDTQLGCELGSVTFVTRVIEGNFPDYTQIIPEQGNTTVLISVPEVVKAIKGAALFSKTGINDVKMSFDSNQKRVSVNAVNAQLGENTGILDAAVSGNDVEIVFNYRYVLDGLQQLSKPEGEIVLVDGISPTIFRSKDDTSYTYVIMPIKQ